MLLSLSSDFRQLKSIVARVMICYSNENST